MSEKFTKTSEIIQKISDVFWKKSNVFQEISHVFWKKSNVFQEISHVFWKKSNVFQEISHVFWGESYFLLLGVDNIQCPISLPPIHTPHFYPFSARFFTFLGGIIRERNKLFRIKVVSLSSNIRFTTNEFTMRHRRTSQRGQVHAF